MISSCSLLLRVHWVLFTWVHVCINLTYKRKSLANKSTPGFSLEDADVEELSGSDFNVAGVVARIKMMTVLVVLLRS